MINILYSGPEKTRATIVFAHGAGGAMDTPWMNSLAEAFAAQGIRLARFEFRYMAARRDGHGKAPPPKAEKLVGEYRDVIASIAADGPLVIGGKSMGGRIASMIADEMFDQRQIAGLLCVGYPFHPINKPTQLRTAHLADLKTPTLICQGTRDAFGSVEEVAAYGLSSKIELLWLDDGNHDLMPRKRISGFSLDDHLDTVALTTARWLAQICP